MREPAERGSSAPAPESIGRPPVSGCPAGNGPEEALVEGVMQLRWLAPSADSLAALGRPPTSTTWAEVRTDPGAVLLLVRHLPVLDDRTPLPCGGPSSPFSRPFFSGVFHDPAPLEEAIRHLEQGVPPPRSPGGFVDWDHPAVRPVYRASIGYARLARDLAEQTGACDPEQAWVGGLLAPLGWLALCAADAGAAASCLADPDWAEAPRRVEQCRWGLDQAGIARRLARRWRLPGWLAAVVGQLGLPAPLARRFGADPVLFPLTRLAVYRGGQQGLNLGLPGAAFAREDASALGLSSPEGEASLLMEETGQPGRAWQDPHGVPLLRDFLTAAADNRRLAGARLHREVERDVDELHGALETQVQGEAVRLEEAKLASLAEFAAGAGHEINNPLTVIRGHAQYLLSHQADWFLGDAEGAAGKALTAIVNQTRRINAILRDLMLFARPAPPEPDWVDLPTLLGEVASGLGDLAAQRRVRVEVPPRPERLAVHADAEQLRVALSCLLRNAIEAAPADGWARLAVVEPVRADRVEVAVEDSGPGPDPAQRPLLFDPFYSGRTAGRGRGLGLPIAWRLARQQGGTVRLDPPAPGRPTRFLLTLPRLATPPTPAPLPSGGPSPVPVVPAAEVSTGLARGPLADVAGPTNGFPGCPLA